MPYFVPDLYPVFGFTSICQVHLLSIACSIAHILHIAMLLICLCVSIGLYAAGSLQLLESEKTMNEK